MPADSVCLLRAHILIHGGLSSCHILTWLREQRELSEVSFKRALIPLTEALPL